MELSIKPINSKEVWKKFIKSCDEYTFLHSWSWGEFNSLMGNNIWRLGIYEGEKLAGVALVIAVKAKRGSFLFVPHGPVISLQVKSQKSKVKSLYEFLLNYLKDLAEEEKCSFIRISPLVEKNEENERAFRELGFRKAPMHMHMESTLLLDVAKPEEELMKNMRKTTRYLIRQAKKKGVEIEIEEPLTGENFLRLQKEVVDRKSFVAFSEEQIKNEIEVLGRCDELVVFNAKYKNEIIASAIIIFYGYRAFYYQAASASKYRDLSAPYLLVWRAILGAKNHGCSIFDFYGASPDDQPNHPWAGPTLFKKGFGGYRVNYLEAQDLILNREYWITWLIETIRRKKRGF